MAGAIAAAMRSMFPQVELAKIGAYVSRGKGQGGHQKSRNCIAMDKRAAIKTKNRAKHRAHTKGMP